MKNTEQARGSGRCHVTECNKELTKLQKYSRQKFCSHACYSKNKVGEKHSWGNKISKKLKGKPKTKTHVENVRVALTGRKRPEVTGKKHAAWKGNKAMYGTLHDWVARQLGRPKHCEKCGDTNGNTRYQWSNISGLYQRVLSDWRRLCVRCHRELDKNTPRASKVYEKKGRRITTRK